MTASKDLNQKLAIFLSLYALFIFTGMAFLAYFGKENLHLYFNAFHCKFADLFFKYFTDFSVNFTIILVLIIMIGTRTFQDLLLLLIPYLLGTLLLTIIRKIGFVHVHRPTYYFELRKIKLHLVEGVSSQIPYTFPSGHTMNAFIFFAVLSLICKNKNWQWLFFLLAILVAISRIYLSKHFVLDTLGGSFLGMMLFVWTFYFLQGKENSWKFLSKHCLDFFKSKFHK